MDDLRHVGVLAHSAEGAALCFLAFCREGFARLGPHQHPDVTLDCIAMGESMAAWDAGRHDDVREILAESARRLTAAGAHFIVCPDNTAHIALERPGPDLAAPCLHIAEVVAAEAARQGMRRVGVLGTRFTMDGPVYRRALQARGIEPRIPPAEARAEIDRVIFEELVEGKFTEAARGLFTGVIDALGAQGCDGAALVCTEIPLLISPADASLPTLDSTRLLAKAALEAAIGEAPLPTWRGGPIGA